MTSINWGRVLLGGLLAGLVMNVSEAVAYGGMSADSPRALSQVWRP